MAHSTPPNSKHIDELTENLDTQRAILVDIRTCRAFSFGLIVSPRWIAAATSLEFVALNILNDNIELVTAGSDPLAPV